MVWLVEMIEKRQSACLTWLRRLLLLITADSAIALWPSGASNGRIPIRTGSRLGSGRRIGPANARTAAAAAPRTSRQIGLQLAIPIAISAALAGRRSGSESR